MLLTELRPENLDLGVDQYEWPESEEMATGEDKAPVSAPLLSLVDLPPLAVPSRNGPSPVRPYVLPAEGIDLATTRFGLADHYLTQIAPKLMREIEREEAERGCLLCWPEGALLPDRPRVLYVGPAGYREGVWDTRVKYIFPDILQALGDAEIHMLAGDPPDFAGPGIEHLAREFGVKWHFLGPVPKGVRRMDYVAARMLAVAHDVRPTHITNIFGSNTFGSGMGAVGKRLGARVVLRIAGDEVTSRVAIDSYAPGSARHLADLRQEVTGYQLADRILVMSENERRRVESFSPAAIGKVHIAQRGVDLTRFRPAPDSGSRPARVSFGYVGRKSLEKGYDLLEQAAAGLAGEHPEILLHMAGTFEPGRAGNLCYHGFVQAEDLPAFYRGLDALVLCSRNEGFPTVVMEAMACGLPCILSRHIFEGDFTDGEDALLIELHPDAIAPAILRLHDDPELANRLARRGVEIARNRFDQREGRKTYRRLLLQA